MDRFEFKLKMLNGSDIKIGNITLKNYTIREIIDDIGIDTYYSLIGLSKITKRKILGKGSSGKLLLYLIYDTKMRAILYDFFNVFLLHDDGGIDVNLKLNTISVEYLGDRSYINEKNIEYIFKTLKEIYCIYDSNEESDDVDDEMAELLREFAKEEEKVKKAKGLEITLDSIIESVSVSHPSLDLNSIFDYTMYQLMHTYYRLDHIRNSDKVMNGIYSGAISSKDIKIEQLNWARKLDS